LLIHKCEIISQRVVLMLIEKVQALPRDGTAAMAGAHLDNQLVFYHYFLPGKVDL
jgi:hypothetical protein